MDDDSGADTIVQHAKDQRAPEADEPVCVLCGRYGEYVCDLTDEDVCSIECRDVCIARHSQREEELARALQDERDLDKARADAARLRQQLDIRVSCVDDPTWTPPLLLNDFACEQLPVELTHNLEANQYTQPTPVQMQSIPCILAGDSVLVSAPTGTGKTAAFLIPIIANLVHVAQASSFTVAPPLSAVVLSPIRELAIQTESVAKLLMRQIPYMMTALLVGGLPLPPQLYRLKRGVQVVIATPGRLLEVAKIEDDDDIAGLWRHVRHSVVDEVDVLVDSGFQQQVIEVLAHIATPKTQLLCFSATIPARVEAFVQQLMDERRGATTKFLRIEVGGFDGALGLSRELQHDVRWVANNAKKARLFTFLREKAGQPTLVFVDSKQGADLLADAIGKKCPGVVARSVHAGKSQQERLHALEAFINEDVSVLVSTSVLSRGIDLIQVENVVIFDLPKQATDYVHLVGRAGRSLPGDDIDPQATRRACVLAFANEDDRSVLRDLVPVLRCAHVRVPTDAYALLHSGSTKPTSALTAITESRRAFRLRTLATQPSRRGDHADGGSNDDDGLTDAAQRWQEFHRPQKRARTRWDVPWTYLPRQLAWAFMVVSGHETKEVTMSQQQARTSSASSSQKRDVYARLYDKRSYTGVYRKRFENDCYDQSECVVHDLSNAIRPNLNCGVDPKTKRASMPYDVGHIHPLSSFCSSNKLTTCLSVQIPAFDLMWSITRSIVVFTATSTECSSPTEQRLQGDPNDPHTLLKAVFHYYCRFGRTGAKGADEKTLDNANFSKLCRDCPDLLDNNFSRTDVDLIFVKAKKKGERRINYPRFLDALGMIAIQKYADLTLETSVPKLLEMHIAKLPCVMEFTDGKSVQAVWLKRASNSDLPGAPDANDNQVAGVMPPPAPMPPL
ncbi:TPA: hypothetical protein N0F65_006895 [Lagenidium giganteum]|uniref:RNA helicase n=1 Tax=Lagenidium giganteum TaxID=4803 RepID=A0AAV2ZK85_9STRA|nr:TPA: hypothetical protein N0F65_006895 [Lagenidium giganteum]